MTISSVLVDKQCQFLYVISCIHYTLLLTLEYIHSASCLQKLATLRPLRIITQMPLLNSLLNALLKCHYSNHYSSFCKCHFYYASLLCHYAKSTLLMLQCCKLQPLTRALRLISLNQHQKFISSTPPPAAGLLGPANPPPAGQGPAGGGVSGIVGGWSVTRAGVPALDRQWG